MRLDDIMVTEDKIDLLEYKFSDFFLIENIQSKYSKMNSSFRKKKSYEGTERSFKNETVIHSWENVMNQRINKRL